MYTIAIETTSGIKLPLNDFYGNPVSYNTEAEATKQIEFFHKTAKDGIPSPPKNFKWIILPITS